MATITLDYPVEVEGVTLNKLEMRRPKVRDQIAAKKSSGSDDGVEIMLFANLCEVAPSIIEDMDMKDYSKLQEVYRGFLS